MKLHVDKEADALYLRLDDSAIVKPEDASPGVVFEMSVRLVMPAQAGIQASLSPIEIYAVESNSR